MPVIKSLLRLIDEVCKHELMIPEYINNGIEIAKREDKISDIIVNKSP